MADDTTGDAMDAKHEITIRSSVARSVSFNDVRDYLLRKGFRLLDAGDGVEAFALCGPDVTWETFHGHYVYADREPPLRPRLARMIFEAAERLERPHEEVLREISGEPVTLEDAKAALVKLYLAALDDGTTDVAKQIEGSPWEIVQEAVEFAELATMLGKQYGATARAAAWLRVAHAAEDLAAIALAELRRTRDTAPPGGSDG